MKLVTSLRTPFDFARAGRADPIPDRTRDRKDFLMREDDQAGDLLKGQSLQVELDQRRLSGT